MVKTRRSSPCHPTLRSGSGRGKNIGNISQADPSSDESGNASSISPKRRRLQSGQGPVKSDGFIYEKLQTSVTLPRVTRRSLRQSENSVVEIRKSRGRDRMKVKKGEASVSFTQKTKKESSRIFVDACQRVRRSERPQRKLYECLKDNLAKTPSMYDLVKRKHDQTPTPEKQSNRAIQNAEEQPGDSDDDDDDDDDDADDDDDDDDSEDDDDNDDDEEEEDEDNDEDEEGEEGKDYKGYQLRKKRPITNRYTAPPMKKSRQGRRGFHIALRETSKGRKQQVPYASPVRRVRRHKQKAINMSSSTSSSDDSDHEKDERNFKHRKAKSMAKARGQCLPMNFTMDDVATGLLKERARIGSSLADVDPMNIDSKVMFDSVGGLNKQIRALKEMVLFPLMYPEVFEKFKISPPRGVLFHGPPGTGKTLVARALANECSQGGKKVAFFMRKGADCLSKWVGESERQLRLLFDQAFSMRPSIIFFDEIDGLAPVRSSRQDQIHSSIVSTLLALMDGLDSRGEIVVIGATNRIDAIDPALRRPGRFDREFQFALPDRHARRSILSIHTCEWEPKLLPSFISEVADHCVGYCGADIKALCTESALFALRRRYPQIYDCGRKLLLDVNSIEVTAKDFQKAMKTIVPASQRSAVSPARGLSPLILPLLKVAFKQAVGVLEKVFPPAHARTVAENTPCSLMGNTSSSRPDQRSRLAAVFSDEEASSDDDLGPSIFESLPGTSRSERYMRRMQQLSHSPETEANHPTFFKLAQGHGKRPLSYRPRFLICGKRGMGQSTHIASALLHFMEHMTVYCLDLPALYGVTSKTPEEACSQLFREARRTAPCIVYAPHLDALWNATGDSLHATLLSLLHDLPPLAPVLFLATADEHWSNLASIMWQLFTKETDQVFQVNNPTSDQRKAFFYNLLMEVAVQPPKPRKSTKDQPLEVLPFAPTLPPRQLSEAELKKAREDEENTMRELRIFLRDVHIKLITDRRFKEFAKPVDLEEVPDYLDVIEEPMDLSTVMHRIDCHHFSTCAQYLADIDLITRNALKYNPDQDPLDKLIRHRACELSDIAHSLIKSQLEPEFEKTCEEIVESRERRGEKPSAVAPPFVFTAPAQSQATADTTDKAEPTPIVVASVAESQPQTTRPRRKKAPIYWGKKPKRKKDARRKLDSELCGDSQSKAESRNDKDEGEDDDNEEETSVDHNKTSAKSSAKHVGVSGQNPGDEEVLFRNSDSLLNGDVTMLDPKLLHNKLPPDRFKSNNVHSTEGRHAILLESIQRNHVLLKTVPNGVTTQEFDGNDDDEIEVERNEGEIASELTEEDIRAERRIRSSGQVAANIKEQLEPVLDLLVENTKWATVEMLERYYSALQCCIHQHRHSGDKTRLIRDLELLIHGFRKTSPTCPEY